MQIASGIAELRAVDESLSLLNGPRAPTRGLRQSRIHRGIRCIVACFVFCVALILTTTTS